MSTGKISKSSNAWLNRQKKDQLVAQAKQEGYRARSAFKLLEIQKKVQLIKSGDLILDLGCAPGAFCQVALKTLAQLQKKPQKKPTDQINNQITGQIANQTKNQIVGVDLLAMLPIAGVTFVQGDACEADIENTILNSFNGQTPTLLLSDMAPNLSGNKALDAARCQNLLELAFDYAQRFQCQRALVKFFQDFNMQDLLKKARAEFDKVQIIKPRASRSQSAEMYLYLQKVT